jgi:Amt family ammonium transporter
VVIYGVLKKLVGIRLDPEQEFDGADLSIHNISSTAEHGTSW